MEILLTLLRQAGYGIGRLLAQPFYYIAILLILLQFWRQTRLERRMFSVRLKPWLPQLAGTVLTGIVSGLAVSAAALFLGVSLTGEAVYWIWGATLFLLLFRVHYLCFAYSAGLLGLLQWAAGWFDLTQAAGILPRLAESLADLDIPGLLLLAALLHGAESLLALRRGARTAAPLFVAGKRGRLLGAYQLQGFWPVPLLLLTPAADGVQAALPWTPLLWPAGGAAAGWTVMALPVVIGFAALTRTMLPAAKARMTARSLLLFALILGAVSAAAAWWQPLMPVAALCAPVLHEALLLLDRRREARQVPLYIHDSRGLCVLAVVPDTPAAAMGILPGEVLYKVNGLRVRSRAELHGALQVNAAFSKLEVLNHEGQSKFLQRAKYEGEHHQLGVVLAPDDQAAFYVSDGSAKLTDLFRRKRAARRRDTTPTA